MSTKEDLFLKANDFVPSKKMGQNFLINTAVQKNIVKSSNINSNDCILEIGPGLGAITQHILSITNKFVAIELDKRLFSYLKKNYPSLNVINDDVLKVDLNKLLDDSNFSNVKVVANLPYSISSKIILKLIKVESISEINILVQKEMADRLTAKINTKDYNAFTVLVSMFADVKHLLKVSRKEFNPQPKVDSSFINIKLSNKFDVDFYAIDKFLRNCFLAKRKKITNNLQTTYDKQKVINGLKYISKDENVRAENLTNYEFIQLYNFLTKE